MQLDGSTLAIWREPIPFPRRREFDMASVRRMRVGAPRSAFGTRAWKGDPFVRGPIAFDLVRLIAERFPQVAG